MDDEDKNMLDKMFTRSEPLKDLMKNLNGTQLKDLQLELIRLQMMENFKAICGLIESLKSKGILTNEEINSGFAKAKKRNVENQDFLDKLNKGV